MRIPLVLAVLAVAGFAGSATSATSARTPTVTYWFQAEFGIGIDVTWSRDSGDRDSPCSTWSHEDGTYEISAASRTEIPPGKNRGSFIHPTTDLPGPDQQAVWAVFNAAGGKAEVNMKRTLVQQGQTNACGDRAAIPTKFPPNDCGARTYVSRAPALRPAFRKSIFDLDALLTAPSGTKSLAPALAIDAPAQQFLYQRCNVPIAEFPFGVHDVALPVSAGELRKLRNLKVGQRVRLETVLDKRKCSRLKTEGETCTAEVDVHVDIKGIKGPRR
jgi:hypothetical protein